MNNNTKPTAEVLGVLGLPRPVKQLATEIWDVIIVGGGHNGLTCAAYLARAGKRVLVLEAQDRIGGACTMEETWPGYRISPCAYLAGLLHPRVIDELGMRHHGFEWTPAEAGLFVPFDDGSSIQLWEDAERCEAEIKRFAPQDVAGWRAMSDVMDRLREALRPADDRDVWLGPPPTRAMLEERLQGDEEARGLLWDWSMVEYVERYLTDERLQMAYLGQGVIGTNASPFDKGTASINFHHSSGRMDGLAGTWGYVKGGIGMVSFIICDIARQAGATVATGVPVARIIPGEGVELAGGETINASVIVSNADPQVTLRLLGEAADPTWQAQVEAIPMKGCTVKMNVALAELPNFKARPGLKEPHHTGQINTPLSKQEWQEFYQLAQAGQLPPRLWTELYFQTVYDDSVAPLGVHTMSVFAQYVPYQFAEGDWDSRREEVGQVAFDSIARYCHNLPAALLKWEVKGPPDIEQTVGLSGGHIFQGECLPAYMWGNRLTYRTPMEGIFLCGAATYPGGSVMAVNGRNAALAILKEYKP